MEQLAASHAYPERIKVVGPRYPYHHVDGAHLTGYASRALGFQIAKAMADPDWRPLEPVAVERLGRTIDVRFHVPAGDLVLDTVHVRDPGHRGFTFTDGGNDTPPIESVRVLTNDTVRITLARAPSGPNMEPGYAVTGEPGAGAGPRSGPRGNLRTTDPARSPYGDPLWDWAVHFKIAVT